MWCPRLKHFARLNPDGTVSTCGHMMNPPKYQNFRDMHGDVATEQRMSQEIQEHGYPSECIRCSQTESVNGTSIRLNAIKEHEYYSSIRSDYLIVGGVLDNICNSGCMTCNQNLSTKIGSLHSKTYPIVNNSSRFDLLPTERIVKLDINGGEPSASPNYKKLLSNLPPSVRFLRLNTNCSLILDELHPIIERGVHVTVTVSLDGIGSVHDYVRWPIAWNKFFENLMIYKSMDVDLNTWTTVSALNVGNLDDIFDFVKEYNLDHSWAFLHNPDPLNVKYANSMTLSARDKLKNQDIAREVAYDRNNQAELDQFVQVQNQLRGL